MCKYKFWDGTECKKKSLPNSKYCILHIDFPKGENSGQFKEISRLKENRVEEKVKKGDFNFEGAKLLEVDFSIMKIEGDVNFQRAVIKDGAYFKGANIYGNILMEEIEVGGIVSFTDANIGKDVFLSGEVGSLWFEGAKIGGDVVLTGATIDFDILFTKAEIDRYVHLEGADMGEVSFYGAKFKLPQAQAHACRIARRFFEEKGRREDADYHFYYEMIGRRRQKHRILRFSEWFLADLTCQYGTNWQRPMLLWFVIVIVILPIIYYFCNCVVGAKSFLDSLYFSIVTATTLGYGDLQAVSRFRILASLEAVFGSFMWVIFIVTFARKHMR